MTPSLLPSLVPIDGGAPAIRDAIAAMLSVNAKAQQDLAVAAGEDAVPRQLNVYTEQHRMLNGQEPDNSWPVVNVSLSSSAADPGRSSVNGPHRSDAIFNVDIMVVGSAIDRHDGTREPAELNAARKLDSAVELVRGILDAPTLNLLDHSGQRIGHGLRVMGRNYPALETPMESSTVPRIALLKVQVSHLESKVTYPSGHHLETGVQITRAPDGQVLAVLELAHQED